VQLIVLGTDGQLFFDAVRRMNVVKSKAVARPGSRA
jgi:hypothetical protein